MFRISAYFSRPAIKPAGQELNSSDQSIARCKLTLQHELNRFDTSSSQTDSLAMTLEMPQLNAAGLFESEVRELGHNYKRSIHALKEKQSREVDRWSLSQNSPESGVPRNRASGSSYPSFATTSSQDDAHLGALHHSDDVARTHTSSEESWVVQDSQNSLFSQSVSASSSTNHGIASSDPSFLQQSIHRFYPLRDVPSVPASLSTSSDEGLSSLSPEDLQWIEDAELAEKYLNIFSTALAESLDDERHAYQSFVQTSTWRHVASRSLQIASCSLVSSIITAGGAFCLIGAGPITASAAGSSLVTSLLANSRSAAWNLKLVAMEKTEKELCNECLELILAFQTPTEQVQTDEVKEFLKIVKPVQAQFEPSSLLHKLVQVLQRIVDAHARGDAR